MRGRHVTRPHTFTIDELEVDVLVQPGETKIITLESPPKLKRYIYCSNSPEDIALGKDGNHDDLYLREVCLNFHVRLSSTPRFDDLNTVNAVLGHLTRVSVVANSAAVSRTIEFEIESSKGNSPNFDHTYSTKSLGSLH